MSRGPQPPSELGGFLDELEAIDRQCGERLASCQRPADPDSDRHLKAHGRLDAAEFERQRQIDELMS